MRKLKKQLLRTMIACGLVISVAVGSTVAYLTDAETATNTFTVGNVQIDLEEPGYPGNDSDEVKNIVPNQEIVKDPQVENTGDNAALVYLKVEVPQEEFTELNADGTPGTKQMQDLFTLKGLDANWELIRTETSTDADTAKTKTTYVYAYRKPLDKGAITPKLFDKVQMKNAVENDLSGKAEDIVITACAIQATDIPGEDLTVGEDGYMQTAALDNVYGVFLNQSADKTTRPADEGNRSQTGKLGKIVYELGDEATLTGALDDYETADYGYTPPTPTTTREHYSFAGWTPESIPVGSNGVVTFTANWKPDVMGTIQYNLDGGSIIGEKTEYTVEDYGYTPPKPQKAGFKFLGWNPETIQSNATGEIVFSAKWEIEIAATLLDGENINLKMKRLAGNSSASRDSIDRTITSIQHSNNAPTASIIADPNSLISTTQSDNPVYAWFENGTIKWWSEATTIKSAENLSSLCYGLLNLTDISGLTEWNTEAATDMHWAFASCRSLINLSPIECWNTENVTNMYGMFDDCGKIMKLNSICNWNTENVTNMSYMFSSCSSLVDLTGLSTWNTKNVTSMSYMFDACSQLADSFAINNWNTEKVGKYNFLNMFCSCPSHPTFTKRAGTWDDNGTFEPNT